MNNNDTELRADAFVSGLLEEQDQAEADAALSGDPTWAAAVAQARDRMLPLDLTAVEQPGAAGLWPGICARLSDPAPPREIKPVVKPANHSYAPGRLFPAGIAAAVGILAGAVLGGSWFAPEPVVIAVLLDNAGTPTAVIEDYGSTDASIRFVNTIDVPQDRQMQVWTLPSAETGPVSMGLLTRVGSSDLNPPRLPTPANGQLYEITLEPRGGSPTGRPTGAILAKGLAARQEGI